MALKPGDQFIKSSFCSDLTACVEVSLSSSGETVQVRSSRKRNSLQLKFSSREWNSFITSVKKDGFAPER